jgi:hypothetical protein
MMSTNGIFEGPPILDNDLKNILPKWIKKGGGEDGRE